MNIQRPLAALVVPLLLAACDTRSPADPPRPQAATPSVDAGSSVARSTERLETGPKGEARALPPNPPSSAAPAPAEGGKDSPATAPMSPLSKTEEKNTMPQAGHGNNHSSESMKSGASQQ
jgi:hypothetical protein